MHLDRDPALLARRTADEHTLSTTAVYLVAAGAILPHLCLELMAYVVAALVGIFVSQTLTEHTWDEPVVTRTLLTAASLLGVAVGLVLVAALVEAHLPAVILQALR